MKGASHKTLHTILLNLYTLKNSKNKPMVTQPETGHFVEGAVTTRGTGKVKDACTVPFPSFDNGYMVIHFVKMH